jgi:hypothetical protein
LKIRLASWCANKWILAHGWRDCAVNHFATDVKVIGCIGWLIVQQPELTAYVASLAGTCTMVTLTAA